MNTRKDPREIAETILYRSPCSVQVGACIADKHGIFSWGWNGSGPDGYGQCAEVHAITRANKKRLYRSHIYVASTRNRNSKIVISKPCENCRKLINKWHMRVHWRNNDGGWIIA